MNTILKIIICLVLLMLSFSASAQHIFTKEIRGKVSSADGDVAATHVLNISTQKAAITDLEGYFSIAARLNDTLAFSAIQFKRKEIVVTTAILTSKSIFISLDAAENQLNEVVVMPYNLSGNIAKDVSTLKVNKVTETSLELPNAKAKTYTQAERTLHTARTWDFTGTTIKLDPIINFFSGRTKMLNKRIARDAKNERLEKVNAIVPDSTFINGLKIPKDYIMNFIFYCEADIAFDPLLVAEDNFKIWKFLLEKSVVFREENNLE